MLNIEAKIIALSKIGDYLFMRERLPRFARNDGFLSTREKRHAQNDKMRNDSVQCAIKAHSACHGEWR